MKRRRMGAGAIVRELRQACAEIVTAIRQASADAREDRDELVTRVAGLLGAALEEGASRAVVVNPGSGRSITFAGNDAGAEVPRGAGPTTPPAGPANETGDDDPGPPSGPRRAP